MIDNRYFILPYPNLNSGIWDLIVEEPTTLTTNLQGNFCVVKLYKGDEADHALLNGFTEYTHEEILVEMAKPEWTDNEI
jgi:hypothetical protein